MKNLFELLNDFYKCNTITKKIVYCNEMIERYKDEPLISSHFKKLRRLQLNPIS